MSPPFISCYAARSHPLLTLRCSALRVYAQYATRAQQSRFAYYVARCHAAQHSICRRLPHAICCLTTAVYVLVSAGERHALFCCRRRASIDVVGDRGYCHVCRHAMLPQHALLSTALLLPLDCLF